ncbi:MAG: YeeE/YedE family protein, partial [Gammaproteobacteria bacterium]|nr:YeeE/YedE family protein [Gammaproteobacteria bacterium]
PIGQSYGYSISGFDRAMISFGLVAVVGVILGSLLWSLLSRSFRLEWFVDIKDFFMHVIGAVLMGFGGVLAMGCTIGQGITGVSTLAIGSLLTFFSIVFGSALTMKIQYYKLVYEDEASFFKALVTSLVDMKLLPSAMRKLDAV